MKAEEFPVVTCPVCNGEGALSKYDEGWRSLLHDSNLAAKRTCWRCAGYGTIPAPRGGGSR